MPRVNRAHGPRHQAGDSNSENMMNNTFPRLPALAALFFALFASLPLAAQNVTCQQAMARFRTAVASCEALQTAICDKQAELRELDQEVADAQAEYNAALVRCQSDPRACDRVSLYLWGLEAAEAARSTCADELGDLWSDYSDCVGDATFWFGQIMLVCELTARETADLVLSLVGLQQFRGC